MASPVSNLDKVRNFFHHLRFGNKKAAEAAAYAQPEENLKDPARLFDFNVVKNLMESTPYSVGNANLTLQKMAACYPDFEKDFCFSQRSKATNQYAYAIFEGRPFLILDTIARGRTKKVSLAIDMLTQKKVTKQSIKGSSNFDEIMEEVKLIKRLASPYIVKPYDFAFQSLAKDGNLKLNLIAPYYEIGLNLIHLPLRDRIKAIADISLGYAYLEKQKVVHNDGKIDNVLWIRSETEEGDISVVIADFGMAKLIGQEQKGGTYEYGAPEVCVQGDHPRYSLPSRDAWALGLIVLGLMTDAPLIQRKLQKYRGSQNRINKFVTRLVLREKPINNRFNPLNPIEIEILDTACKLVVHEPTQRLKASRAAKIFSRIFSQLGPRILIDE